MTRINQIWALIFVFIVVFLQGSMINMTSIILPTLGEVFKLDMESQGRLQSFGVGGMMVFLFLGGIVTRSIGARLAGVLAVILMGAGAMVMAKALSYELVLVAMFVMGLGIQLVLSVHSWVVSTYFHEQRQRLYPAHHGGDGGRRYGRPLSLWGRTRLRGAGSLATRLFKSSSDFVGHYCPDCFDWLASPCGPRATICTGS